MEGRERGFFWTSKPNQKKTRIIEAHKIHLHFLFIWNVILDRKQFSHCLLFLRQVYWWIICHPPDKERIADSLVFPYKTDTRICGCAFLMLLGLFLFSFYHAAVQTVLLFFTFFSEPIALKFKFNATCKSV